MKAGQRIVFHTSPEHVVLSAHIYDGQRAEDLTEVFHGYKFFAGEFDGAVKKEAAKHLLTAKRVDGALAYDLQPPSPP